MSVFRVGRVRFWREVAEGARTLVAAERSGVSLSYGKLLVRQAGGMVPAHLLLPASGRFLSPMDRVTIAVGRRQGLSQVEIARLIGRSPSTVSRELARNTRPKERYDARLAQFRAEGRLLRPRSTKLAMDPRLRGYVQDRLGRRWSPEQISNMLRRDFPHEPAMRISTESIYRAVFRASGGLTRDHRNRLRTGRTLRRPRKQRAGDPRIVRRIPALIGIAERPAEANDREMVGHWEGDLIVGRRNSSQIATLVERRTRFCVLVHLPISRNPDTVASALTATIRAMPKHLVKTLTWDRGMELAGHQKITADTGIGIYFCDARSPWQRGSNENTNGLLRQYFPKGTDLSRHSAEYLTAVVNELNARPRKCLGWRSPSEVVRELMLATQTTTGIATTS